MLAGVGEPRNPFVDPELLHWMTVIPHTQLLFRFPLGCLWLKFAKIIHGTI